MCPSAELLLSAAVAQAILDRAAANNHEEIVGMIAAGHNGVGDRDFPLPNLLARPDAFVAAPRAQFLAEREIAARQKQVVALYHSHPLGDASFSEADRLLAEPWRCAHLVIGLRVSM